MSDPSHFRCVVCQYESGRSRATSPCQAALEIKCSRQLGWLAWKQLQKLAAQVENKTWLSQLTVSSHDLPKE